jgi:hypothetical protein
MQLWTLLKLHEWTLTLMLNVKPTGVDMENDTWAARHIHKGIIKVPTVSTLCYIHLQVAWQTEGQRHSTTQSPCVTRNVTRMSIYISQ